MLEKDLFFHPSSKILKACETGIIARLTNFLQLFLLLSICAVAAHAQGSSSKKEDEDLIKSSRPTIANPAEFQKPGILQIEYGYDGNFRADEFRSQQSAPLTVRFAPVEHLLLDFNIDTVISEKDEMELRETGVGDTRLGVQFLALKDTEQHPALAFAFYVKVPTASSEKNLGTGRTDYRVVALLSKKMGKTDIDFNGAYLNVGREFGDRRASGGQAALSFSREFENNFGIVGEVAGQSEDDGQPRGIFGLGAMTYKVNKRLQFDTGLRFGLNPGAPRVGCFAGFTVGVGSPFKKK
ncbi:MAG: transporter [Pyrinomonadaceae bacterium]